jgi:hypothetical protein
MTFDTKREEKNITNRLTNTQTHRIDVINQTKSTVPWFFVAAGYVGDSQHVGLFERLKTDGEDVHRVVDERWFGLKEDIPF